MAFVSSKKGREIGDEVILNRKLEACSGYFEKGTKVKISAIGERGYDFTDEYGNTIGECGWNCF